jgi:hypothetical protein
VVLSGVTFASAQEITESHLKAARAAITATHATDSMDSILPQANQMLKVEMIQKNPDREADIVQFVDDETLALVPRRGDLEKGSRACVRKDLHRAGTERDRRVPQFAGRQEVHLRNAIVGREVEKAVNIWQIGIARDLSQAVAKKLAIRRLCQRSLPLRTEPLPGAPPAPEAPKQ